MILLNDLDRIAINSTGEQKEQAVAGFVKFVEEGERPYSIEFKVEFELLSGALEVMRHPRHEQLYLVCGGEGRRISTKLAEMLREELA